MHDPPHAGEIIREDCLRPLGLTVTAAAAWLGVSRQSLSELLNGRSGVSADMAIRLAFRVAGPARLVLVSDATAAAGSEMPRRSGPEWLRDFFEKLTEKKLSLPESPELPFADASPAPTEGR